MKKVVMVLLTAILAVQVCLLTSCNKKDTPTVVSVSILGAGIKDGKLTKNMNDAITFKLSANVEITGDIEDSVSWSSSDELVATVLAGNVTLLSEGNTTITVTSIADITKTATVLLTVIDDRNLAPGYPDEEFVNPLEFENLLFSVSNVMEEGASLEVDIDNNKIITITYNELAATSNWKSYVRFTLPKGDYSRATGFGMNISCTPNATLYVKFVNSSGANIWEGDIASTPTWTKQTRTFSQLGRAELADLAELFIYVPRPETTTRGGEVSISRVWLEGDASPSVVPNFVFDEQNIKATIPLIPGASGSIVTSGFVPGTNEKLEVDFSDNTITVNNTGYNDWKNLLLSMPKNIPYGEDACWLVFDITNVTGNPFVKFYIMGEPIREIYPVAGTRYYASYYFNSELQAFYDAYSSGSFYMQIAPSYLASGAAAGGFTINGIYIMK